MLMGNSLSWALWFGILRNELRKKNPDAYLLFFKTLLSSRFSVVKKYMYYETNLLLQLINIKLLSSFPFSILQVSLCWIGRYLSWLKWYASFWITCLLTLFQLLNGLLNQKKKAFTVMIFNFKSLSAHSFCVFLENTMHENNSRNMIYFLITAF